MCKRGHWGQSPQRDPGMSPSARDSPGLSPSSGRGGQGHPQARSPSPVRRRAALCSHVPVCVHTQEALICALTCPAMHKSSLPVLTPTHTHKHPCTHTARHQPHTHSMAAELILGRGCTGVLLAELIFTEEAVATQGPWPPHPRPSILLQRHTRVTRGVSLVPPLLREAAG